MEPCDGLAGLLAEARRVEEGGGRWRLIHGLACVELLALAAMRAKQRQDAEPTRTVVLQIEYDAYGDEPPLLGERYVLAAAAESADPSRPGIAPWRAFGSRRGQRRERGRPVDDPWSVAMLERLAAAVTHFLTRTRTGRRPGGGVRPPGLAAGGRQRVK